MKKRNNLECALTPKGKKVADALEALINVSTRHLQGACASAVKNLQTMNVSADLAQNVTEMATAELLHEMRQPK